MINQLPMDYIVVVHAKPDHQCVVYQTSSRAEAEEYYEEYTLSPEIGDTMVELKKVDESGWQTRIKKRTR